MQTIDAIFTGGKFEPLSPVDLPENERVQLTVNQPDPEAVRQWFADATAFRERLAAKYGAFHDSTEIIAEDRRRDG